MNYDLLFLFIFGLVLLLIMFLNKKKVHVEKILFPIVYMIMYRTKIGLNLMDNIAKKYPKIVGVFAFLGILVGFFGMVMILFLLTKGTYGFLFLNQAPPVAPLFPGVKTAPGLPVLSFWHWIIAIFILAGVHEFSHGLVARLHKIKVKSSGFAVFSFLLPIIPAAFVEPDEGELSKSSNKVQLGVLSVGSFSNLITAGVFFLIFMFILAPIVGSITVSEGVKVAFVEEKYPAFDSGIKKGEVIVGINGKEIRNVNDFKKELVELKEGEKIEISTKESIYDIVAVKHSDEDRGYLGISVIPENQYIKHGIFGKFLSWLGLLMFWVFAANLGVGLFNLLPMGPLDGGKMFYLVALSLLKKEKTAKKVWIGVSLFCLILIVISLAPFLSKLLSFVFGLVTALI